jgi:mRNA interferase MazF
MEQGQYSIVLVNLDPTIGSEINKTRPCVILSPDEMNQHLRTIIIAPMTSVVINYPTRVNIKHNNFGGRIVIDQIRIIDRQRVVKTLGRLSQIEINDCKKVIFETYVD